VQEPQLKYFVGDGNSSSLQNFVIVGRWTPNLHLLSNLGCAKLLTHKLAILWYQCASADEPNVSIRAWSIPYETLRKRINGKVSRFTRAS
jgi:hypothetical protein